MSILTEQLPTAVIIRGQRCPIRADFKTWLAVSELMQDGNFTMERVIELFRMVFCQGMPPNLYDAFNEIVAFFIHEKQAHSENRKPLTQSKPFFDFSYDADLIFSAFMQQYGLDLTESDMHWWKFKALLGSLSEETLFMRVVRFRSMDLSKIKDKEQRSYYLAMKALYKLPDNQSAEQKELTLKNAMAAMF